MNYAEEQLQNAIENENEKLKEEIKDLKYSMEYRDECFIELNKECTELKEKLKKCITENKEYKDANISLGNFRIELQNELSAIKSRNEGLVKENEELAKQKELAFEEVEEYSEEQKKSFKRIADKNKTIDDYFSKTTILE